MYRNPCTQHRAASTCVTSTNQQGRGFYLQVAVNYIILVAMLDRIKDLLNAVATNIHVANELFRLPAETKNPEKAEWTYVTGISSWSR